MPLLPILTPAQSSPEVVLNENFGSVEGAGSFGYRPATSTGLTWGHYGAHWGDTDIPAGTVTLAASATNYITCDPTTGAVSVATTTTAWATDRRIAKIVTGPTGVASWEDHRFGPSGALSGSAGGGGGGGGGPALSNSNPAALGAVAPGTSAEASRADHVHPLPVIPAPQATGLPASPDFVGLLGVASEYARADHVHPMDTMLGRWAGRRTFNANATALDTEAGRLCLIDAGVTVTLPPSGTVAAPSKVFYFVRRGTSSTPATLVCTGTDAIIQAGVTGTSIALGRGAFVIMAAAGDGVNWHAFSNTAVLDYVPTQSPGDNGTRAANTAFVTSAIASALSGGGGYSCAAWTAPVYREGIDQVSFAKPSPSSNTVPLHGGLNPTTTGTATGRAINNASASGRLRRIGAVSAATAGSLAGFRVGASCFTSGAGSLGGALLTATFMVSDAVLVGDSRMFIGASNSTAAPSNVDPGTLLNHVGVGHGSEGGTLKIYAEGSASQTPIDLGANFPVGISDAYRVALYFPRDPTAAGYQVGWHVVRIGTAFQASGVITGALGATAPASTVNLTFQAWRSNNTTAAAVGLDVGQIFLATLAD